MDKTWFCGLIDRWAEIMAAQKDELIRLDGLCGDSDLGLTMSAGFRAAADAAQASADNDIGLVAYQAGKAMGSAVPSTMGTLMASGLMNAGMALKSMTTLSAAEHLAFWSAFYLGVKQRGKAEPGDKTVLDGLKPAVDKLEALLAEGVALREAAPAVASAAQAGCESTRTMIARHGRMAIRGEASRTFLDPGAMVATLLVGGWADWVTES